MAFTEHGAIMAATILNSPRAAQMSVYVVRAFVKARELLASNAELARELNVLKKSIATLDADTRRQFDLVYEAIIGLMSPAAKKQWSRHCRHALGSLRRLLVLASPCEIKSLSLLTK